MLATLDLKSVLRECRSSADTGYEIASAQVHKLDNILTNAKIQIQQTIEDFSSSPCYDSDTNSMLMSELSDIQKSFDQFSLVVNSDLKKAKKNLSKFSVTLFGKTTAGKSTLMEVLTNGDGKSIGKGAQRTTRDIRKYTWNDLEITDVPGIGAFEGKEDEDLAFEAAKSGDLILFLFTDDAPQPDEAECFSSIISLGKPVICVMNVKCCMEDSSYEMAMMDLEDKFDMTRLKSLKDQFLEFSKLFGQEWVDIPFVFVHLNAEFLSQHTSDKRISKELHKASRIDYLKNKIVHQVETHGKFYRIRTLVDLISKPLIDSMDTLLSQSNLNSFQGRTVLSKKRSLETWKDEFLKNGLKQIESYIKKLNSDLKGEIANFTEEHFDDEKAGKAWEALVKTKNIEVNAKGVLEKLDNQATQKIKDISRELKNELTYAFSASADLQIKMSKIIDGKKIVEWTTTIVAGGLGITSGVMFLTGAALAGPIGWIALGVTGLGLLLSFFFKNRQKKELEARKRLESELSKSIDKMCGELERAMKTNLDLMIKTRIIPLCKELNRMISVVFQLSNTQKELAWGLNKGLLETNMKIINEAIRLIGASGLEYHINAVARIPGVCVTLCLNDGVRFPEKETSDLHHLIGERINFVFPCENKKVLISRVIGKSVPRENIRIEEKIGVAHISVNNESPELVNRIKMAQQLSELLITK